MTYEIETSSKIASVEKVDGQIISSDSPIKELRKLIPDCTIERGDSFTWNLALWSRWPNVHLYYVAKKKTKRLQN